MPLFTTAHPLFTTAEPMFTTAHPTSAQPMDHDTTPELGPRRPTPATGPR